MQEPTVQEARLRDVNLRCLQLKRQWENPDWWAFFFVRQTRFAMCFVGKAGSVSWSRIMLQLTGNRKAVNIAALSRDEVQRRFLSYVGWMKHVNSSTRLLYMLDSYKIMVVRDPLARLMSAYRHLIVQLKLQVTQIRQICRPNVSHRLVSSVNV